MIVILPYQTALVQKIKKPVFLAKATSYFNLGSYYAYTQGGKSTWAQDAFSIDTFNINSEIFKGLSQTLIRHRESIVSDVGIRIKYEIGTNIMKYLPFILLLIFLIGIMQLSMRSQNKSIFKFLFIGLTLTFIIQMFFAPSGEERHIYWYTPLVLIGISSGVSTILKNWPKRFMSSLLFSLIIIIVSTKSFYSPMIIKDFQKALSKINNRDSYLTMADSWFLSKHHIGKIIMARHEGYGFYSRNLLVYAPNAVTLQELLNYANLWKVNYIIARAGEVPADLIFLVADPKDYPGLKLVANNKGNSNERNIIYQME